MYHDKPKSWMNYVPIKSLSLWDDVYDALISAKSQTDTAKVIEDLNSDNIFDLEIKYKQKFKDFKYSSLILSDSYLSLYLCCFPSISKSIFLSSISI